VTTNPFQNPTLRWDTNGSGAVTPLDALQVINALTRSGSSSIDLETNPVSSPVFPDVNGDGSLTPLDALLVINRLAARSALGEGEQVASQYVSAGPGVLASGTTAVGDALIRQALLPQRSDSGASEAIVETVAPNVVADSPSDKTSVFDSPAIIELDSIVDDLAVDSSRSGESADGDSGQSSLDDFFATL